jgi:hypothetical protein
MARYNPELMQLDDGATGTPRIFGPRNDTSQITDAEMQAASIAAAKELAAVPYADLPIEVKKAMTTEEKREYVTAQREEATRIAREEAVYSDPLKNPNQRPDAQTKGDNNYIQYYSWVGGTETGNWRLTRVPRNEDNLAAYGGRQVGGPTRTSETGQVSDANTLVVQPTPIRDNDGQITGWEVGDTNAIDLIGTDGKVNTGTTGTSGNVGTGVPGFTKTSTGTTSTKATGTSTGTSSTGLKSDAQIAADTLAAGQRADRQSAYDLLLQQFNQYGLGALVTPLKDLITSGASPSEFTIKLRESDAYKKRFSANSQRITKGLAAISEAEYLGLEDQYQNIMRNYGLPAEYYTRGDMGIQAGFEKFIANDVSAAELEDRVMTAQSRVLNANPEVLASLKAFYPDITNGDILAYTLDPTKGLTDIKRKVTSAEIGGAAAQAGLGITGTRAGELTAAGITKQQAQQGFQTVAEVAPRGGQLAEIYKQNPYTQNTAEAEVFGLAGSTEAARQRKKLTQLETAAFSGSAGAGAIARDRAGVL